jgi:hypothetical protein
MESKQNKTFIFGWDWNLPFDPNIDKKGWGNLNTQLKNYAVKT